MTEFFVFKNYGPELTELPDGFGQIKFFSRVNRGLTLLYNVTHNRTVIWTRFSQQ